MIDGRELALRGDRPSSEVSAAEDSSFTRDPSGSVGPPRGRGPGAPRPGSHRWPILDHQDGVFAGAIDVEREGVDVSGAVPVTVRAGGIILHHTRMLHASAPTPQFF